MKYQTSNLLSFYLFLIFLTFGINSSNAQVSFELEFTHNTFPHNPYTIIFDEEDLYFYVANDNAGVSIYEYSKDAPPILLSRVEPESMGNLKVMNITKDGDFIYTAMGSFFDGNEQSLGLSIIDVSDVASPFVTDFWTTPAEKGSAAIQVDNGHAYLGGMSDGLFVFDVSNPGDIKFVSSYIPNRDFPIQNPTEIQEPNARGLAVVGDIVYLGYDAGGLSIIDVSDKSAPDEISRYINQDILGLTQQAYNDVLIHGNFAYITTDYCGIEIVDISDANNGKQIDVWNPWNCESNTNTWLNSDGHANQLGWLPRKEGEILIVNANDLEIVALDVKDPSNILAVGTFGALGDNIRTWGLGIGPDFIAGAYYFTFLPWISTESAIKMISYECLTSSTDFYQERIQLFPNPANGIFQIDLPEGINRADLKIYAISGEQLLQKSIQHSETISVQEDFHLKPGVYFVELKFENHVLIEKLIVY